MGYNARNDEIRDNIELCGASAKPTRDALAIARQFNRGAFNQEASLVLAGDCRRAHPQTSLVSRRLRQSCGTMNAAKQPDEEVYVNCRIGHGLTLPLSRAAPAPRQQDKITTISRSEI